MSFYPERAEEALKKIKVVAIADDMEENRSAAVSAAQEIFPDAEVRTYSAASEIISAMRESGGIPDIDLVLTDMNMEEELSGLKVAQECATWWIPCIPVTGGIKTHTTDQVRAGGGYPNEDIVIHGEKDDPEIWKFVLRKALLEQEFGSAIIKILYYGKREKDETRRWSGIAFCSGVL
jgi:CheY-like chemotaxis protein